MMTKSSETSRQQALDALARAKRQQELVDAQASEVAEEVSRFRDLLLDKDHLAPRVRKAMKLRFGG